MNMCFCLKSLKIDMGYLMCFNLDFGFIKREVPLIIYNLEKLPQSLHLYASPSQISHIYLCPKLYFGVYKFDV